MFGLILDIIYILAVSTKKYNLYIIFYDTVPPYNDADSNFSAYTSFEI